MLKHTFIHIPGIGNISEQRFWESGIQHWDQFAGNDSIRISPTKMDTISTCLDESYQHLESRNPNYFSALLPANQHWRFFPEFRDSLFFFRKNIFAMLIVFCLIPSSIVITENALRVPLGKTISFINPIRQFHSLGSSIGIIRLGFHDLAV